MRRYLFVLTILLSLVTAQVINAQSGIVYQKDKIEPIILTAPRGLCFIPQKGVATVDEVSGSIIYFDHGVDSMTELFTAEQTGFMSPYDIACSKDGVLYIADSENNVIKKIIGENVYTLAGTGEAGYAENYMDGDTKVYSAKYNYPMSAAVDSEDNVYISDTLNHCIRKIDSRGNSAVIAGVPTVKGYMDGDAALSYFNEPCGIAVDKKGNVYVADSGNHRIRMISGGTVTTIAGASSYSKNVDGYFTGGFVDGYARSARFNYPKDVAVSEDGVIFVADTYNNAVRAIKDDNVVTICGTGTAGINYTSIANMMLNKPSGVLVQGNELYISDTLNGNVIKLTGLSELLTGIPSRNAVKSYIKNISYQQSVTVYLNDTVIDFDNADTVSKGEKSEAAVRYLCDALHYPISWDNENNCIVVTKDNIEYSFINDEDFYLQNGRAYINIRNFTNRLNIRAEWFPEQNIFVIVQ